MHADNPFEPPRSVPEPDAPRPLPAAAWFLRLAGAVLCAFGLLMAGVPLWALARRFDVGMVPLHFDPALTITLGVAILFGLFCLILGGRLVMLLPNARGSLLSPLGWYLLAAVSGALSLFAAVQVAIGVLVRGESLLSLGTAIAGLGCGFVFCGACVWAARARPPRRHGEPAPEEPRAPLRMVTPAEARAWVEIFNDDSTPMEFVVHALCTIGGLRWEQATALMLRIHREGSALLPCVQMEEALALAAQFTEQARAAGHPLTARAREEGAP